MNSRERARSGMGFPIPISRSLVLTVLMTRPFYYPSCWLEWGARAKYVYDFGDWWEHELEVEAVTETDPGAFYPVCSEGQRRCPPEDAGGTFAYQEMLDALGDRQHEDHEHWVAWVGAKFDAEAFSLEKVNKQIARLYRARKATSKAN
jgi:hypothetical protein